MQIFQFVMIEGSFFIYEFKNYYLIQCKYVLPGNMSPMAVLCSGRSKGIICNVLKYGIPGNMSRMAITCSVRVSSVTCYVVKIFYKIWYIRKYVTVICFVRTRSM